MLKPVRSLAEVPPSYRGTPIADLLAYHNLGVPHSSYAQAVLLVGMCMDPRVRLRIPENFAFIMRAAGANFRETDFQVSFALAVGGVQAIVLIGHNQCGMENLHARRGEFIDGLTDGVGWSRGEAESHFDSLSPEFEIGDAGELVRSQTQRLRLQYPRVVVAPLMYDVEDGMLYQLEQPAESSR